MDLVTPGILELLEQAELPALDFLEK